MYITDFILSNILWCRILELVRTAFAAADGEEVPPLARPKPIGEGGRKSGKAAEPHR